MYAYQQTFAPPVVEGGHWIAIRDGDHRIAQLYRRHYSSRLTANPRGKNRVVAPGERIVLITAEAAAGFIWVKSKFHMDGQYGVNCQLFRNESKVLSSLLLKEAMQIAQLRWGNERLYTYVDPASIRSPNPGYCFKVAGWKQCGITKEKKLLILEYIAKE